VESSNKNILIKFQNPELPIVCVQGLGFVGAAMSLAVADASDTNGDPLFNVIGVDLPTPDGKARIDALNAGSFPFETVDNKLLEVFENINRRGNLIATSEVETFSRASIVLVDVHLDIDTENAAPRIAIQGFKSAIEILGQEITSGVLVIIETTVPPGTCENIVAPLLCDCLKSRGMSENDFLLAHSYERVMPGVDYYDSIINFWRVYSGLTDEAADACGDFLSKIINTKDYPLTRLKSTRASETAKLLENSYRATNIAFIEEWGRFAEAIGIDLFEVIEAIRVRPTHNNIRQPGFGVGGYCLTKDPLFASLAAKSILNLDGVQFPFCTQAVRINQRMPLVSLDKVEKMLDGSLQGRTILLLGVSYRPDVGDTRYSPSQTFVENAYARGAEVICHDPLVRHWPEMDMNIPQNIPEPVGIDAVVFASSHEHYRNIDLKQWFQGEQPCVLDANNVLTESQRTFLKQSGYKFDSIGRG